MTTDPKKSMTFSDAMKAALEAFIGHESIVNLMIAASIKGQPAVQGIDSILFDTFAKADEWHNADKQYVGRVVKTILKPHGYVPEKENQDVNGKIFTVGTVYKK